MCYLYPLTTNVDLKDAATFADRNSAQCVIKTNREAVVVDRDSQNPIDEKNVANDNKSTDTVDLKKTEKVDGHSAMHVRADYSVDVPIE